MKVLSISLENFASYKSLEFNFEDQGITLIQGPTGAGKSTLCDAIPWILFGTTAKGGAVNEVISWQGRQVEGEIRIDNPDCNRIVRIRGQSSNDLYFEGRSAERKRGKDLKDTQNLINELLGINQDLYLAGAYCHEFSQTAQFFQTTAKNRRAICEQLVDLSLPKTLQEKTAEKRKHIKNEITNLETEKSKAEYKLAHLTSQIEKQGLNAKNWQRNKQQRLGALYERLNSFDETKANRLNELQQAYEEDLKRLRQTTVCSECGAPKAPNLDADSPIRYRIDQERARENTFAEQIVNLEAEVNPFTQDMSDNHVEIQLLQLFLNSTVVDLKTKSQELEDLELLAEVNDSFRAVLLSNTISNLEHQTNKFLTDFFDAEIRVSFTVEDADKVEVSIFKDGNTCVYTQLSKGQRCLLKLCFGVSVMREVANHHGVKFDQIFFDEALDGLDGEFKLKALSMLQSLESDHAAIFLVEHSFEIKSSVNNYYYVQLVNGHSVLNEKAG